MKGNIKHFTTSVRIFKATTTNKILKEKNLENPGIDPGTSHMLSERSTIWANSPVCIYPALKQCTEWPYQQKWGGLFPDNIKVKRINCIQPSKVSTQCKMSASAGSRTRIDCLEGNHANRYTTDATWDRVTLTVFHFGKKVIRFPLWTCIQQREKYPHTTSIFSTQPRDIDVW